MLLRLHRVEWGGVMECVHIGRENTRSRSAKWFYGGGRDCFYRCKLPRFWSPWNSGDSIDHRLSARQASSPGQTAAWEEGFLVTHPTVLSFSIDRFSVVIPEWRLPLINSCSVEPVSFCRETGLILGSASRCQMIARVECALRRAFNKRAQERPLHLERFATETS